jgi:hypothetical protein
VFSLYDVIFNVAFVAAAAVAAVLLPEEGKSLPVLLLISGGYVVTAVLYARRSSLQARLATADNRLSQRES